MEYLNYYVCGTTAGCFGALLSHPAFILKTELQNGQNLSDIIKKMRMQTITANRRFLYNGLARMCFGLSIEKMLVFGTFETVISHYNLDRNNFYHSLGTGFIAGIAGSMSSCVTEQLVIDKGRNVKNYDPRHLYKALLPTMARESIGFAAYFTFYNQLSKMFNPDKTISGTIFCGSGAISGALIFFFPMDKIKTNVQSGLPINVSSFKNVYKGVTLGLPRSLLFHVTCFICFEQMMKQKLFG